SNEIHVYWEDSEMHYDLRWGWDIEQSRSKETLWVNEEKQRENSSNAVAACILYAWFPCYIREILFAMLTSSGLSICSYLNYFTGASNLQSEVENQGFNRTYVSLKNAFKNTLIKPREDYVDVFFRHLEQCANIWTPQQFYAPYTSLIQASGTGKSRLLRELAFEKDVFVVYICLRDSESRGYPKRSIIADVLTGQAFSEAHYITFLSALFGVCSKFLDQQLRENMKNTCGRVFDMFISDKDDEMFELQNTFWNNVSKQMKLQETSNKPASVVEVRESL
ncbi:6407_t:CDS:2, partial [Funneliformis mosseae]